MTKVCLSFSNKLTWMISEEINQLAFGITFLKIYKNVVIFDFADVPHYQIVENRI